MSPSKENISTSLSAYETKVKNIEITCPVHKAG
jgi:hypothetical protein